MASVLLAAIAASGCGGGSSTGTADSDVAQQQSVEVAAVGDIGIEPAAVATLKAMGAAQPDLVLALGDLSYAGPGSESEFCDLVDSTVGADVPFEVVSGNHEDDTGEDGDITAFARCLPDRLGAVGDYGSRYYFDVGSLARFIMLSPDLTIERSYQYYGPDDDGSDTPDLAWLKQTIEEARANDIRWVIVGMHKNCISVGEYYCDVYQDLFTTLIDEGVDLVLTGHDHTYQRSKQINAPADGCPVAKVDRFNPDCVVADGDRYERGAGTTFVVAGTGGDELYRVNPSDREAGYFVTYMGKNTKGNRHGFAELEISPERLAARFVGSTPGTFTDRFEIVSP